MQTIMTFDIVVDPEWVGSTTPYRVRRDGRLYRPMDMADAQREMKYALHSAERKGVSLIAAIRAARGMVRR
jgi:hypothetical protein